MLRLNVGERTSLNRDVKTISTLAPQESLCLSALRSEPGLICFQPAGETAASQRAAHAAVAITKVVQPIFRKERGASLLTIWHGHLGEQDETSHYQWSPSIRLQPLLDLVKPSGEGNTPNRESVPRVARHLACQAAQGGLLQASFCVGVVCSPSRAGKPSGLDVS